MKYTLLIEEGLSDEHFLRLTGIRRSTFDQAVKILEEADQIKKSRGGRKSKLSIEDRLLMTLEYLRENRTYFHVAKSYGLSESNAYKIIRWVEEVLMKHPDFALPGKKALQNLPADAVVLVDVTETPVERPKKNKSATILAKRNSIQSKVK